MRDSWIESLVWGCLSVALAQRVEMAVDSHVLEYCVAGTDSLCYDMKFHYRMSVFLVESVPRPR
jgi:hypothetical protein